jgi:long-chain acyl-CoA synthetase
MLTAMRKPPSSMNVFQRAIEVLSYWLVTASFDVFPLPQRSGFRDSFVFAGKSVDRGYSLLIFPEGQRTTSGEMSPFRTGIGILAKQLNIPVVPMRIDGLFPLKLAHRHFARQGQISIVIGEPVRFQDQTPPEEIARTLENAVSNLQLR